MNVSALLRPPLVWLVVAEVVLMVVLGSVAWHVWQQRIAPLGSAVAPLVSAPIAAAPTPRPGPLATPAAAVPHAGPTPAVGTDAGFLTREMAELNRAETAFEDLEWRATRTIVDGIQRYVTAVVLPSIDRAEKSVR